MNRILEVFKKPKVLLPVVHAIDQVQVRANVMLARKNGADGVFLINQGGMEWTRVLMHAERLASELEGFFVGVNILGFHLVLSEHNPVAGLWQDDAGVCTNALLQDNDAALALAKFRRSARGWNGVYFGGVAFKGRQYVEPKDYGYAAAAAALGGVDVVTTSGHATGSAPDPDKLRVMREAIGDHALALASGVTPENVTSFLPYVDAFLVATGIEERFGWFDPARLRDLAATIHG